MKLKTLLALAAATLALAACNKQPEPTPTPETTLSVNPTSYEFKAGDLDKAQEFIVTSNAEWEAPTPAGVKWFTVAEENGKGNGKFKVTVIEKNETGVARSAKVTVKAGNVTKEVTISQAAATFAVEPDYLEFTEDPAPVFTDTINVTSTFAFDISTGGAEWIQWNKCADDTTKIIVSVAAAADQELRQGEIHITSGKNTATVKVAQRGMQPGGNEKNIYTAKQFVEEIQEKDLSGATDIVFNFANDLDFTYATPVEYGKLKNISATIDGCGKKIINLKETSGPLLKQVSGTIKNIIFDGSCECVILPNHSQGILCEQNLGTISGIENNGKIIVGNNTHISSLHWGAIMGINRGLAQGCVNNGNVEINCSSTSVPIRFGCIAGSLAANNSAQNPTFDSCENHGNITVTAAGTSDLYVGGIVGLSEANTGPTTITSCKNIGKISYTGADESAKLHFGGLIGTIKAGKNDGKSKTENCSNTGEIDGGASLVAYVGGLFGDNLIKSTEAVTCERFTTGCSVNCTIKMNAKSADNRCSFGGFICGQSSSTTYESTSIKVTYGGPITVGGMIVCDGVTTKVADVTEAELPGLCCGAETKIGTPEYNIVFNVSK